MRLHRPRTRLVALAALLLPVLVHADVWVFEPSAGIDLRLDDNFTIDPELADPVFATRVVGTLGLSREAPAAKFSGIIRVDGLLSQTDSTSEKLTSNQILFLNSEFTRARSKFGIGFNLKRDTPSRDIAADITDISSVASDTGASVTQDENVARLRLLLTPNWQYNLTRRTTIDAGLTYTQVEHELPSAQDALRTRFLLNAPPGTAVPNPLTIEDTGFFTVLDELDDFKETAINVGITSKLSPISTVSFLAGYSDFSAQTEPDPIVIIPFEDTIADSENRDIRRNPKRETLSTTSTFRVGYDRAITQTLNLGFQIGVFANNIDETDVLRESDTTIFDQDPVRRQEALDARVTSSNGFLANITASKLTGITRYSARFGVDVLPSDIGAQVESLEAIGDLVRELGPLLDFSFRIRAFEPDALNAGDDDRFARRFLSLEPKLTWRFSRAWTTAASIRYRRQKSQIDTRSGESNALLFSLKYTPPSAIRDAERARSR